MSTTSLLSKYGLSFHPSESILLALFLVIGLSLFLGELFERIGLDAVLGQDLDVLGMWASFFDVGSVFIFWSRFCCNFGGQEAPK